MALNRLERASKLSDYIGATGEAYILRLKEKQGGGEIEENNHFGDAANDDLRIDCGS